MEEIPLGTLIAAIGFGLAVAFGATAQRANFCTMGAISDIVTMRDYNRFRAWMLAIAVAMLGSEALDAAALVDLDKSIYRSANLGWFGAILGGLMFGFGMTLAGGCGSKTLVRLGAGNLKSLVVFLILGIFAYMTLRGLTGLARVELEGATMIDLKQAGIATQGIPDIVATVTGMSFEAARWLITALFAGGLAAFCFANASFRASPANIAAGIILGLLVVLGWYATGAIGNDEFEPTPVASLSFVSPVGESLIYLMTFTGSTINFGIAVVGGVIVGAFVMAKATGQFRFESFAEPNDMVRHIVGAALMGMGGILAMGCTIGQGITGMSTLALGSLIALISIVAGGVYGLKYLEHGSLGGALAALLARG